MEIQVIQHGMDSIISITSHFPIIISKCKLRMCCEYAQHLRPIEYLPKIFAVRPSLFCCNFKYLFITAYAYKTAMGWQSNCVLHTCAGETDWREQRFVIFPSFLLCCYYVLDCYVQFVAVASTLSNRCLMRCRRFCWCFPFKKNTCAISFMPNNKKKSSRRTVHKQLLHT